MRPRTAFKAQALRIPGSIISIGQAVIANRTGRGFYVRGGERIKTDVNKAEIIDGIPFGAQMGGDDFFCGRLLRLCVSAGRARAALPTAVAIGIAAMYKIVLYLPHKLLLLELLLMIGGLLALQNVRGGTLRERRQWR